MRHYKRKIAAAMIAAMLCNSLDTFAQMPDLQGHWAKESILNLQKEGLVSGYADGNFWPNKEITRAEFIASINKMFGFTQAEEINFDDVRPQDWYAKDIAIAVKEGYAKGYADGNFRPNQTIRRVEAAVFLARANKLVLTADMPDVAADSEIPKWARAEVQAVMAAGIMKGYTDKSFRGNQNINRAEAVIAIDRAREVAKAEKETAKKSEEKKSIEKNIEKNIEKKEKAKKAEQAKETAKKPAPAFPPAAFPMPAPAPAPKVESGPAPAPVPRPESNPAPLPKEEGNPVPAPLPKEEGNPVPAPLPREENPQVPAPSPEAETPPAPESQPSPSVPNGSTKPKEGRPNTKPKHKDEATQTLEMMKSYANKATFEMEGETRTILWAKGVTGPQMGENGEFRKEVTGDFIDYKVDFAPNKGWYDVNKTKDGEGDTSIDLNLCYGAVASNMLHWWFEQNEAYIARYLKIKEKQGAFPEEIAPLRDYRRYVDSFREQSDSEIFKYFKVHFGKRKNGFHTDLLLDMFVNGYKAKDNGGTNDSGWDKAGVDQNGGFFYDVFGKEKVSERRFRSEYAAFGRDIASFLTNEKTIGIEHHTGGKYNTHIVMIWGAEYDEAGKIKAIYISDSDDQNEGQNVGMKRITVKEFNHLAKLSNNPAIEGGSEIENLHIISLKTDKWEQYFEREDIQKIEAEINAAGN